MFLSVDNNGIFKHSFYKNNEIFYMKNTQYESDLITIIYYCDKEKTITATILRKMVVMAIRIYAYFKSYPQ